MMLTYGELGKIQQTLVISDSSNDDSDTVLTAGLLHVAGDTRD